MTSCPKCNGFAERMNLETPDDYRNLAGQLIKLVDSGTFSLVQADCPLDALFDQIWPGDVLIHKFKCTNCGREFKLAADTYHGSASWSAL
jgi:hypothetical protein